MACFADSQNYSHLLFSKNKNFIDDILLLLQFSEWFSSFSEN